MTDFSIGNSGGGKPKAGALPVGTKARIVEASIVQSSFTQTIQKGPRKGQTIPRNQLKVVYETGDGQQYVQYYGGVYPKDNGGYNITQAGSTYIFVDSLRKAGVEPTGKFEDYVGLEVSLVQFPVRNPSTNSMTSQAMPSAVHGRPAIGATKAATQATPAAPSASPYDALPQADKDTLQEALSQGPVSPSDLVEAGIASDTKHAEAILSAAPKQKKPLLGRK